MSRKPPYPREVRERAVKMLFEHRGEYDSEWAAIGSIAEKFGMTAETLRGWVRRAEIDGGQRPGTTSADGQRIWELATLDGDAPPVEFEDLYLKHTMEKQEPNSHRLQRTRNGSVRSIRDRMRARVVHLRAP